MAATVTTVVLVTMADAMAAITAVVWVMQIMAIMADVLPPVEMEAVVSIETDVVMQAAEVLVQVMELIIPVAV
jgi:predicted membrane channel-forming protein YqfA (hemolysin III family)